MKALIISDKESDFFNNILLDELRKFGYESEALVAADINPCCGCLRCWTDPKDNCIQLDMGTKITEMAYKSDLLVLVSLATPHGYSDDINSAVERIKPKLPAFFMISGIRDSWLPRVVSIGIMEKPDPILARTFKEKIRKTSIHPFTEMHIAGVVSRINPEGIRAIIYKAEERRKSPLISECESKQPQNNLQGL